MPNIVTDLGEWRQRRGTLRGTVGFVPTMGDLHEGHISLVERARRENDNVVVSVFVNPTQFNQAADFEKYRRVPENDTALLADAGVDCVLMPSPEDMYPDGYTVQLIETEDSKILEGAFRPGHFTGMLTVVMKLLNIVQADHAYFGEKDFQQLVLVRKMSGAFFLPVQIIPCGTKRAADGLALSSRNARLTPEERVKAPLLVRLLRSSGSDEEVMRQLAGEGFRPEYVATKWGRRLAAAWLGETRLIDNIDISEVEK